MRPPVGHLLVALATTALGVGPVTASAAPTQAEATARLENVTVQAGTPGKQVNVSVDTRGRMVTLYRGVVVFDFAAAAQTLRVAAGDEEWESCSPAPGRLVCTLPAGWDLYGERDWLPAITVAAQPAARAGASGAVAVTVTDPSLGTVTTAAVARVVERLALSVGADQRVRITPDSGFSRELIVRNDGPTPISGLVAEFSGSYNVDSAETNFANCRYDADGYLLSCAFDTVLAPGRSYRTALPMWVYGPAYAPGEQQSKVTWMTPMEAADAATGLVTRPGTGPPLVLSPLSSSPPVRLERGLPAHVSYAHITVTGRQVANAAVTGTTVRARAGQTVELTATVTNHGPADLETLDTAAAVAAVDVTLPQGVTLVEAPEAYCEPRISPGNYRCYSAVWVLAVGQSAQFAFTVRVDRLVYGGAGRASLVLDDPDLALCEDPQPADNTAELAVQPA